MEKTQVAFFTNAPRFTAIGFHPSLDKTGVYKKNYTLGPGQYVPKIGIPCVYKNNQQMPPWTRQLDSEEFSKHLGFRMGDKLAERQFMAKHLGPGSHEIDCTEAKFDVKNTSFGTQRKFFEFDQNIPGPGTYHVKTPIFYKNNSSALSTVPRFKDDKKSWSLPSNRYEVNDTGSLKALINKVVSLRGPYDLFTGSREDKNMYNKFSMGRKCTPDKYYTYTTDFDYLLHNKTKQNCGKFLQAPRFPQKPTVRMMLNDLSLCYRNAREPSPAHYNMDNFCIKKLDESKYPFGLTSPEDLHGLKWTIFPGPGRYHIKERKCRMKKPRGTSVFLSKTQRPEYKAVDLSIL